MSTEHESKDLRVTLVRPNGKVIYDNMSSDYEHFARNFSSLEEKCREKLILFHDAETVIYDGDDEVITKGKQTQFIPYNGVYVIARQYNGKTVMTILNGKRSDNSLKVERYAEIIGSTTSATDVITGQKVDLGSDIKLSQRQALILEF